MPNLRHVVDVMRPTKAEGTLGELRGQPEVVLKNWPCSIKALSGNEQEQARQIGVTATYKLEGYGDPKKPFDETMWAELGTRKLNFAHVDDVNFNGLNLVILAGENK